MSKIFLYDNKFNFGAGEFASVQNYRLIVFPHLAENTPEAVKDENESIYGYIYDVSDDLIEALDAYYAVGLNIHTRIKVKAKLEGGVEVPVYMWELNHAEVAY